MSNLHPEVEQRFAALEESLRNAWTEISDLRAENAVAKQEIEDLRLKVVFDATPETPAEFHAATPAREPIAEPEPAPAVAPQPAPAPVPAEAPAEAPAPTPQAELSPFLGAKAEEFKQ